MLKCITVIVICYFGKLENDKSSIFGLETIYPRHATRDTRHAPIKLSPFDTHLITVILVTLY